MWSFDPYQDDFGTKLEKVVVRRGTRFHNNVFGHTSVCHNASLQIYVFAGFSTTQQKTLLFTFDILYGRWMAVVPRQGETSAPSPRYFHRAIPFYGKYVYTAFASL